MPKKMLLLPHSNVLKRFMKAHTRSMGKSADSSKSRGFNLHEIMVKKFANLYQTHRTMILIMAIHSLALMSQNQFLKKTQTQVCIVQVMYFSIQN